MRYADTVLARLAEINARRKALSEEMTRRPSYAERQKAKKSPKPSKKSTNHP